MREHRIEGAAAVTAVMAWDGAAPPAIDGEGACLALRASMARFSAPSEHAARRADVETAVAGVDNEVLAEAVSLAMRALIGPQEIDAAALSRTVPVAALAAALGLGDVTEIVADVDQVAAVIGRGLPVTPAADDAAERLLAAAEDGPGGAVATASLLYQCLDATAALLLTTLHAGATGSARVAAVPRTRRTVMRAGAPGGVQVQPGDDLVVEIGAAGLEFGTGPHACPGRELAESIVATVTAQLGAAGYEAVAGSVEVDADGRPTAMTLHRR